MEKSSDVSNMGGPLNVTPSAPPSYDEAIAGNFVTTNTGLYPGVPFQSFQGPQHTASLVTSANPQSVQRPYPIQDSGVISIQTQRPLICRLPVGPKSLKSVCPSCQRSISTRTNTKNRLMKYICCLLMFGSVICTLCSCLPLCLCPSTKVEHFCPSCNAYLGTYVYS